MPEQMYCVYCGVALKLIERDQVKHVGRGELPMYVHVTKRSEKDPVQCTRANLLEREATPKNWWEDNPYREI